LTRAALALVAALGCSSGALAKVDVTSDAATRADSGSKGGPGADASEESTVRAGHDAATDARLAHDSPSDKEASDMEAGAHWIPAADTTFYWDLSNANSGVNNGVNVGAYDIDGWDNDASEVNALHAMGKKVVCYMDVGTYEPGRPDSSSFPAELKGNPVSGWPGEYWLDVRPAGPNYATLQAIMLARFNVCKMKGFDAVEPDNLDSYENSPGSWSPATSASDQLTYDEWVAATVHSVGLAVFQKNDTDQVVALEPHFDGELDEECNYYSECDTLAPYIAAHKPVWNAEYTSDGETTSMFCAADVSAKIAGALFDLNLDGMTFEPCSDDVGLLN